jgi:hypothetical protein
MLVNFNKISQEIMRIDSNGMIGIGTSTPVNSITFSGSFGEWQEILELSKTNSSVKLALEKLRTTYYLSKDHGNSET